MAHACPNALSLAAAVAIGSSIIGTQALADRKLQTKSADILGNKHAEFTWSEVMVRPTSGPDQQPIPKSITTTYPYEPLLSVDYVIPSLSFTEVLYGIEGGASSVDQFETDENDVAQMYTKVLKVGDEGIFRFTHNLEEKELIIEVRGKMTDQDSIDAVRDHLHQSLEPLTKIASPEQLADLLKAANSRAGNLGKHDHYVALAIIEVEKVEVRGRTFMRLIASGDQPPDLQSLGQSLFVNDEALLAAATSAYIRVHALGEDLQQQALNELLAHSKPVGYVVLAEDDTRVYPVPAGYPKLEVAETPGEVIVFHGQKLNPNDAAFVENLYKLREEAKANNPVHSVTTQVKNYKVESYQYVIRSSQMALLEEFAARHGAEANEGQITLEYEDKVAAFALANYESLLQALSSATPDRAGEFELTPEQIRAASTVITPTWMQSQLLKHFSFKPALRDLLTNPHSVEKILKHIPIVAKSVTNILYKNKKFAFHFLDNMVRKLTEVDSELEELLQAVELRQLEYKQQHESDPADASDEIKLIAQGIHRMIKDKLAQILVKLNDQRSLQQSLIQEIERIPLLRQQVPDARKKARSVYNSGLAIQLGIDDWDDAQPLERQARRLLEKIDDKCSEVLKTRYHSTEQADDGAVKAKLAAIEGQLGITPINENDLDDRYRSIQQHLIYKTEQIIGDDPFILIIKQRPGGGLVPFDEADLQARDQVNKQQSALTEAEKAAEIKARFAVIAEHLNIQNFRGDADIDTQLALLLEKIKSMKSHQPRLMNLSTRQNDPLEKYRTKNIQTEQMKFQHLLNRPVQNRYGEADIKRLQGTVANTFGIELENPGTKGQIARLEILEKLDAVEKALIPAIKRSLFDDVRTRYNEIAHHLGIEDYKYAAPDIVKIHLIKEELKKLSVKLFALGDPDVNERIATINAELNWQMARLGSKPRYVLDREVARAKGDIEEAETELEELHRKLDAIHRKEVAFTHSTDVHPDTDKDITVLNQAMKHTQTGSSLTQGDNQTPKDQLDGIERFIQKSEDGSGRRVEIVQKLIATIRNLKIPFDNDPDNLSEEDYINAIVDYAASYGRDKADEVDYLGKLPETRRQYTQITEFLHEHDFRKMELAYAQDGEKQAQEELDTKNRAIDHSRNIDPETKTKLKDERDAQALILEWRKAVVSEAQANLEVHGASLRVIEDDVGLKPEPTARLAERVDALRNKQVQLGGLDGTGGMIQQLTEEQDSLNREIEIRKARIVILKGVLESAEEAIENEGVSFQYTPGQAKILTEIHTYMGEHSFRKQALEAAMGLAKSAELSSKSIPNLQTFDLDDEFAPIRLQALVGDHMTFDRARRTVEIFKNLKTTFTIRPTEDQSLNPLGEAQKLADRARSHIKTGPQHYDDEIHSMGEAAIHFIEHEPRDLKSFSEYFAAHSVSGNRIIALLSESLISKVELENYMEAIRGVDEYQTMAEFEHFLGYKHGVKVPEFQKVVRMLSDRGTKEFMHSAFTPVTATGTTGMKESVAGMKVYAAAVIANYVLDDIAFENGRK
ncbi:hypothetical protein, partial [Endozoicomonas sp. SESOKO2]|uniref:hypothetical protein n=1 Tax=Endozoicomonas sp. SESOKO2 TaxID=2828743 RepID=UPI0021471EFF